MTRASAPSACRAGATAMHAVALAALLCGRGVYEIPISGAAARRPPSGPPAEVDAPDVEREPEEEQ